MKLLRRVAPWMLLLLPAQALGGSVFLNGTRVDGLANTKIDKCSVEFDAKGNVLLNCPGYAVSVEQGTAPAPEKKDDNAPPPVSITRRYFMVTEQAQQGMTEYDIDLFINSKFIRKLKGDEEQIVSEITKNLLPGKNTITFVAKKHIAKDRRSYSPGHFFRVVIGDGNSGGDKVMIDEALLTFQKTAADTEDATQEFTLNAR
jgi:hypothetical protein